ncbi:hypothetical protein [Streptomyces sp. NPDC051776]|uniref:hypothetical protein n=1 Tax=Streptomyces sp. NPDC051776 TaxID=3155414 RepID=UPI003431F9F2
MASPVVLGITAVAAPPVHGVGGLVEVGRVAACARLCPPARERRRATGSVPVVVA